MAAPVEDVVHGGDDPEAYADMEGLTTTTSTAGTVADGMCEKNITRERFGNMWQIETGWPLCKLKELSTRVWGLVSE